MFATAAAIGLMCQSLSSESLHDVWNPAAGLFPFLLLCFLCWSLACGEHRLLPLTVLVASFVTQTHLTSSRRPPGCWRSNWEGVLLKLLWERCKCHRLKTTAAAVPIVNASAVASAITRVVHAASLFTDTLISAWRTPISLPT